MKKTSSLKSTVIVIVVIALALLGYFYYKGSNSTDTASLLSQGTATDSTLIGSQVLTLLSQIQSLTIDSSLFTDPGYQTLRDYSVQIPAESVGRTNPFAPLPGAPTTPTTGSTAGN